MITTSTTSHKKIVVVAVTATVLSGVLWFLIQGFLFQEKEKAQSQSILEEPAPASVAYAFRQKYKILYVMSYHESWKWTQEQFDGFKDENGVNVPYQEVLQWTSENSNLPDFTFWDDRISYGTLCTVTVSGYEQGLAAGEIARGILVEGNSPASYPMKQTVKGEPYVSLARAKKLGLAIESEILLTARVVQEFEWEK